MGGLGAQATAQADSRFEAMLSDSFAVLLPNEDDFSLAKLYLGKFETGLRAGDAFHLAIAAHHCASRICSLDKSLIKAGRSLGLPVSMGIQSE